MKYINLPASELQELALQILEECDKDQDYYPFILFMEIYRSEVMEVLDKMERNEFPI
ncbi:MAG TPA: hypothetical protein VGA21_08720 [Cyclobacteriaceae bacterium]|jgi:hypothetical protein